jgi:hypothetical protein
MSFHYHAPDAGPFELARAGPLLGFLVVTLVLGLAVFRYSCSRSRWRPRWLLLLVSPGRAQPPPGQPRRLAAALLVLAGHSS